MNHIYFVVDFTYNPKNKNPLKILELGDAFTAGWVAKKIGKEDYCVRDRFIMDLKKQYPDALLVYAMRYGVDLIDLSNDEAFHFYNRSNLFDDATSIVSPSQFEISDLIEQTLLHSEKRTRDSRLLLINIDPNMDIDPTILNESEHLKIANHHAGNMRHAFYNKKVFNEFASGSPAYPETLFLNFDTKDYEKKLTAFIENSTSDDFVLKPINGTRSEGVHVVSSLKLKETLRKILKKECYPDLYDAFHLGILIQASCPSKSIEFDGNAYFAKGRAVIRADFTSSNDPITLNFLAGYWQLAQHPNARGVNDETLIACGSANQNGVFEIEQKEWAIITGLFNQHLPSILQPLINDNDARHHIRYPFPPMQSAKDYKKSLKKFLHQNFMAPSVPRFLQKTYYWWNTHIANITLHQEKKFIVDLVGIHPAFKNSLTKDNQSMDGFIDNAISNLYDNHHVVLNESFNCSTYFRRKHKDLITGILFAFIINSFSNDDASLSGHFAKSALFLLLFMGILEGIEYCMNDQKRQNKSSEKAEDKMPISKNSHRFFSKNMIKNTRHKEPLKITLNNSGKHSSLPNLTY